MFNKKHIFRNQLKQLPLLNCAFFNVIFKDSIIFKVLYIFMLLLQRFRN